MTVTANVWSICTGSECSNISFGFRLVAANYIVCPVSEQFVQSKKANKKKY